MKYSLCFLILFLSACTQNSTSLSQQNMSDYPKNVYDIQRHQHLEHQTFADDISLKENHNISVQDRSSNTPYITPSYFGENYKWRKINENPYLGIQKVKENTFELSRKHKKYYLNGGECEINRIESQGVHNGGKSREVSGSCHIRVE